MIASRRMWTGLLLTLAFLWLVLRQVDVRDIGAALQGANYWLLLPAGLIYFGAFWLRALRWRVLLSPLGSVSVGRAYWVATIEGKKPVEVPNPGERVHG